MSTWFENIQSAAQAGNLIGGLTLGAIQSKRNRQTFEWNKHMQMTMMDREDNAVQRRAADMRAAGINPLLAAGSPAQAQNPGQLESPKLAVMEKAEAAMRMITHQEEISMTRAQKALIRAQEVGQNIKNKFDALNNNLLLEGKAQENVFNRIMNEERLNNVLSEIRNRDAGTVLREQEAEFFSRNLEQKDLDLALSRLRETELSNTLTMQEEQILALRIANDTNEFILESHLDAGAPPNSSKIMQIGSAIGTYLRIRQQKRQERRASTARNQRSNRFDEWMDNMPRY